MYNCLLVASFYIQESCFCEFGTFVIYYVQEGEFSVTLLVCEFDCGVYVVNMAQSQTKRSSSKAKHET